MKFQPGNKLGKKFQPRQSENPAGRPPKWRRLARELDEIDDPFLPRVWMLAAAGATLADLIDWNRERESRSAGMEQETRKQPTNNRSTFALRNRESNRKSHLEAGDRIGTAFQWRSGKRTGNAGQVFT